MSILFTNPMQKYNPTSLSHRRTYILFTILTLSVNSASESQIFQSKWEHSPYCLEMVLIKDVHQCFLGQPQVFSVVISSFSTAQPHLTPSMVTPLLDLGQISEVEVTDAEMDTQLESTFAGFNNVLQSLDFVDEQGNFHPVKLNNSAVNMAVYNIVGREEVCVVRSFSLFSNVTMFMITIQPSVGAFPTNSLNITLTNNLYLTSPRFVFRAEDRKLVVYYRGHQKGIDMQLFDGNDEEIELREEMGSVVNGDWKTMED